MAVLQLHHFRRNVLGSVFRAQVHFALKHNISVVVLLVHEVDGHA